MSEQEQGPAAIVVSILQQRAAQRKVPLSRRRLTVSKGLKDDFTINKHEVEVQLAFVLAARDPVKSLDRVLDAVVDFDTRLWKERAKTINEIKSNILKWSAYLERTLSDQEYERFIASLIPPSPNGHGPAVAEGEHYQDRDLPFAP